MKKIILSVAIIAGLVISTNVQKVHAINEQTSVSMILGDDGFVDVKLQDLSEAVQTAISAFTQDYDIAALKYNSEKQLTKVELTKKEDQSGKVVYLNAEGEEVEAPEAAVEPEKTEQEAPSAELSGVMQDNGYVNIKFDELNEKVQDVVRSIAASYDITSLRHSAEQSLTEVKGINKEDKSEKVFYLNEEGKEVEKAASQEQEQKQETEESPMSL